MSVQWIDDIVPCPRCHKAATKSLFAAFANCANCGHQWKPAPREAGKKRDAA